jgi:hypothetical protein
MLDEVTKTIQTGFPLARQCLTHQLPENQAVPMGLVCCLCKQQLSLNPSLGECRGYWESQPVAYSLSGSPCFVYVLDWENYQIRSLHPEWATSDSRAWNWNSLISSKTALATKTNFLNQTNFPDSSSGSHTRA